MIRWRCIFVGLGLLAVAAGFLLPTPLRATLPRPALAQIPNGFTGFRVRGRHLYDALGNKVILVGVNKMVIWTDRDGLPSFPEIARTGANAVRIVWLTEGSAEELDTAITNAINHKLIPIVDCHDSTGKWDLMPVCVDYWVRPDIAAVLRKHERYLLINIANEAGAGVVPSLEFRTAYELAIRRIRAAGLHVPLIIDAQGWGQHIDDLQAGGPYLVQADPDHNVMFSIHMWWPSSSRGANVAQLVTDEIAESVAMELPLLIGEFANEGPGCTCCIPYETIIEQAHLNEVGYLAWSWGPGNQDCAEMDMTEDGTFDTLHGWGLDVAVTNPHSIRAIAVRPDWIAAMTPVPISTPVPTPTPLLPNGLLSLGKPVEVSSVEGEGLEGPNAVDGRLDTRWSSAYTDPQTLTVDLGAVRPIARIVLEWETAFGREYKLQVSEDGVAWADVVYVTGGDGGQDDHSTATTGRYVRMLGLKRGTQWGYSLYEVWVFDRNAVPLPQPAPDDEPLPGGEESTPAGQRPDLAISEITWTPDPVQPGDAVTFGAVVENRGMGITPLGAVRCGFQIGGHTVAWGEFSRVLAPGTSATCTANTPWGPAGAGEFIVLGWVDDEGAQSYGRVEESDETNNMAAASGRVREPNPTPTAKPTLPPSTTPIRPDGPAPATARPTEQAPMLGWVLIPAAVVMLGAILLLLRWRRHRPTEPSAEHLE